MEDAVVYLADQGARVGKIGERMIVRSRETKIVCDIPFFRISQIFCFGSIEFGCAALTALMRRKIDVVFLTIDGRFKTRLSNLQPNAVKARVKQYERNSDPMFRLKTARALIRGKLSIQRVWLMRQNRTRDDALTRQIIAIKNSVDSIDAVRNIEELMGMEGVAARCYFDALKIILKQDLAFNGRIKRPPTDPVNAMLSFGYTILFNKVLSAVERVGLDPMIGSLHALEDRRPSLALDLMEEFRTLIVDSAVTSMVNRMEVTARDFFQSSDKGTRMFEHTIALLVKRIQERLAENCKHPVTGLTYEFKDMIVQQAYQYKSYVLGEKEDYIAVSTR